jgi:hypothetical protein
MRTHVSSHQEYIAYFTESLLKMSTECHTILFQLVIQVLGYPSWTYFVEFQFVEKNTAHVEPTLMPSFAVVSAIVNRRYSRIAAWARSTFSSFVDVDGRLEL